MASIRGGTEVPVGAGFMSAVTLQGMPTSPVTFTPDDLAQDPYSSSIPFDSNAADSELPSDAVPGTEPGAAPEVAPDASPDSVGIEPESSKKKLAFSPETGEAQIVVNDAVLGSLTSGSSPETFNRVGSPALDYARQMTESPSARAIEGVTRDAVQRSQQAAENSKQNVKIEVRVEGW